MLSSVYLCFLVAALTIAARPPFQQDFNSNERKFSDYKFQYPEYQNLASYLILLSFCLLQPNKCYLILHKEEREKKK